MQITAPHDAAGRSDGQEPLLNKRVQHGRGRREGTQQAAFPKSDILPGKRSPYIC
jgi:hypothetical protein